MSAEIYRLIASPTLPAIPLLTACGYVLAESRAAERLVRFFRALFGWMPGGVAVLVAAVCALFTTFTGGSGVTIIALGGLVYPILRKDGYPEGFSLGLVTAAGSLGLLFPPSLPVILYASSPRRTCRPTSSTSRACCRACCWSCSSAVYGILIGRQVRSRDDRRSRWREAVAGDLGRQVGALGPGPDRRRCSPPASRRWSRPRRRRFAYAVVVECFITRDIHSFRDLPRRAAARPRRLMGAVLILLASAMGLTS